MKEILKKIANCKNNIDQNWFFASISSRFEKIEKRKKISNDVITAASEIILLYSFYMDLLKENNESVKRISRDYYFDFQYIRINKLVVDEKLENYINYKNNISNLEKLLNILPKNQTNEEKQRETTYTGLMIHKRSRESLSNPTRAKKFLQATLRPTK